MKTLSVFLLSGMILFLAHTGVAACNLSPIAVIETNMTDDIFFHDEAGSFSGTNSYPYCGSINEYRWRVRPLDGTFTTVSSNSVYFHTFTLENNVDEKQYQVELRVRNSAGKYDYKTITVTVKRHYTRLYYLTDHLGSVRVTVNDEGDPVGWDDYYPFGLQMPGRTQNTANSNDDIKFTGYELEQECETDGTGNCINNVYLGLYHAEARMYDPVIGRFNSVDPMVDQMPSWNPYHYTFNNPLKFIDPDGRMPTDPPLAPDARDVRNAFLFESLTDIKATLNLFKIKTVEVFGNNGQFGASVDTDENDTGSVEDDLGKIEVNDDGQTSGSIKAGDLPEIAFDSDGNLNSASLSIPINKAGTRIEGGVDADNNYSAGLAQRIGKFVVGISAIINPQETELSQMI